MGKGLAKYLVLSGKNLSAKEAEEIGLVDKIISSEEMFDLLAGGPLPDFSKHSCTGKWLAYSELYQNNNYTTILEGNCINNHLENGELEKLIKVMRFKAPVAMQFAETLIDEGRGPASELEKLISIFTTQDAMLGLSSIGQRVEYQGK